nr:efflux RND transporter periplasmic adaptor subunit [Chromatiales bacterium]
MNKQLTAVLTVLALGSHSVLIAQWDGLTNWSQPTELATATSGVVAQVGVNAGEMVKRGQLLLQLDQRVLTARLEQAQAELHYQTMHREEAAKELARAEELYERTLLADHDLDVARIAATQAEAGYQGAVAAEQMARQELAYSELRAPFDARVLARYVQPGQAVVHRFEAPAMLVLAEQGRMRVDVVLSAEEAAGISNGQSLQVEVGGLSYAATVAAVQYQPDQTYLVQAVFAVTEPMLAGLPAKVRRP